MLKALFEHWPSAKSPEPPKPEGMLVVKIFLPYYLSVVVFSCHLQDLSHLIWKI